jgi:hypothetical protein
VDGKMRAKKENGRLLQGRTCDAVPYINIQSIIYSLKRHGTGHFRGKEFAAGCGSLV